MLVSFFVLIKLRRPSWLVLKKWLNIPHPVVFTCRKSLCCVTKYLHPVAGASSVCKVTLDDFLPISNVIPSVFCYFLNLKRLFDIFLTSYLSDRFQASFGLRLFLWAALSKFISTTSQSYRPSIASGLPQRLFLIETYVTFPYYVFPLNTIDSIVLVKFSRFSSFKWLSLCTSVSSFSFTALLSKNFAWWSCP